LILTGIVAVFYVIVAIIAFITSRKTSQKEFVDDASLLPHVTIQIPTYNELAALNCAKMCMNFDYPAKKVQIIIGDDSSNVEVSNKINNFALQHPDQILVTRRGNNIGYKPGNLNHMLGFSTGEIIVIFDSDFLPKQDFLKRIVSPFILDPEIAAVQARWSIKNFEQNLKSLWGGTITYYTHYVLLPFAQNIGGNCFLCGSAEAIRKNVLEEIGPWSEGALTEDIEYSLRLMSNNKKILFLPQLKCEGEAPFTFTDLGKQQMRWAYGNFSAFKTHFRTIFKRKSRGGVSSRDRLSIFIFWISYFLSVFVFLSTIFGFLTIITINPYGINLSWDFFLSSNSLNLIIISSLIFVWIISLVLSKNSRSIFKVIVSMFTIGLIIPYYIMIGIVKALFGREMRWFLVKKGGNEKKISEETLGSSSSS
jgi:cellulose synthase/poly-beta-1,6-N-acetylglucosamine synthase-like glycosyltransferase